MATTDPADHASTWDELRRLADQLELEVHLAGMEARDRWRAVRPRINELEAQIRQAGGHVGHVLAKEIASLRDLLRGIDHRDD